MITSFVKSKFKDWNDQTMATISIHGIKYIRTFSIEEFKRFFNKDRIVVKLHESGILYFEVSQWDEWGFVTDKGVYKKP